LFDQTGVVPVVERHPFFQKRVVKIPVFLATRIGVTARTFFARNQAHQAGCRLVSQEATDGKGMLFHQAAV